MHKTCAARGINKWPCVKNLTLNLIWPFITKLNVLKGHFISEHSRRFAVFFTKVLNLRIYPPMFHKSIFSFASLLAILVFFSCKTDPKVPPADNATKPDTIQEVAVSKDGAVIFRITQGTINWAGKKSMGDGHNGTINVEQGELLVNQDRLINGKIIIDMHSIAVSDIKDAGERRDLESHLRDSDFFEAEKYPKAEFVIQQVLPSNNPAYNWLIVGDLTMKGKTKPVNIPANLSIEGDKLKAQTPTFPINRTEWGVNFKSGILGTSKDKLINDNVMLSLTLEAKKG